LISDLITDALHPTQRKFSVKMKDFKRSLRSKKESTRSPSSSSVFANLRWIAENPSKRFKVGSAETKGVRPTMMSP